MKLEKGNISMKKAKDTLIAMVIMVVLGWLMFMIPYLIYSVCCESLPPVIQGVQQSGLKGVVDDVWYGAGKPKGDR